MQSLRRVPRTVLCIGDEAVRLNFRCSFLKQHGWNVLSSGTPHEGIIRFSQQEVDAVILDFDTDAAQAALVAGQLKRVRPQVPVVVLVPEGNFFPEDTLQCADLVVPNSDQPQLLRALAPLHPGSGNA